MPNIIDGHWAPLTVHITGMSQDGSILVAPTRCQPQPQTAAGARPGSYILVAPPPSQPQPGVRWEQRHWQPDWLVCLMVGVFCGASLFALALAVLLGGLALVGR